MRIELRNIKKKYGNTVALEDFSYTFVPGIYALLGPNGAGKSTLMNIMTMNVKADFGALMCDGETINRRNVEQLLSLTGYMPQQQTVYPSLSLENFMHYMASLKKIGKSEATRQIEDVLKRVDLWDVKEKKLGGFSGGMKQRALLAQSFLGNPKLIILDEPTAGLDPLQRIAFKKMIKGASKDIIIIISTHVLSDVQDIADEVLFLKSGKLINNTTQKAFDINESLEEFYTRYFG